MSERRVLLAVQGQIYGPMFDEKLTHAACKSKPSWHVISTKDRTLSPAMEEAGAKKAGGKSISLPTCHVPMLQERTTSIARRGGALEGSETVWVVFAAARSSAKKRLAAIHAVDILNMVNIGLDAVEQLHDQGFHSYRQTNREPAGWRDSTQLPPPPLKQ